MKEPINFYSTKEPFGEFSNFSAFPINIDGKTWLTSEHYFQAQKFTDEAYQEKIRTTASPMIAARLGRSRAVPIRENWNEVRDEVMYRALRAKFDQHEKLRFILRSTGDRQLIEHAKNDSY